METFPITDFPPRVFQIFPSQLVEGSGASLDDAGQVAERSGGGHWIGVMREFKLTTPEQHRKWRALLGEFDSGVGEMILPIIDFSNDHLTGGTFTAAAAVRRATQLTISNSEGKVILGGEYMTIVHPNAGPCMYLIKMNPEGSAVRVRPPLREAITSGTLIDFVDPRFVARLTCKPEECWPALESPLKARPSFRIAESFKWLEALYG